MGKKSVCGGFESLGESLGEVRGVRFYLFIFFA